MTSCSKSFPAESTAYSCVSAALHAASAKRTRTLAPPERLLVPIEPSTPVLVGYGQVNHRDGDPTVEPVDLMEQAARAAADPRVLESVDSIRIVNLLSWRYRNPG